MQYAAPLKDDSVNLTSERAMTNINLLQLEHQVLPVYSSTKHLTSCEDYFVDVLRDTPRWFLSLPFLSMLHGRWGDIMARRVASTIGYQSFTSDTLHVLLSS